MMICSFIFLFASELKGVSVKVVSDQKDNVPYCSVGLVKAYFSRLKLKKKDANDFMYVAIEPGFHVCGSGFLVQDNIVVTAAHLLMPIKFKIGNEAWFVNHVDFSNCEQLPYKVEFYPFYPHNRSAKMRSIGLLDPHEVAKPGETPEEFSYRREQEVARKYFIIPEKWRERFQDKQEGPSHDYAILCFPQEKNSVVPSVKILENLTSKVGKSVAVLGYPTCFYNEAGILETNKGQDMFEVSGKTVQGSFIHIGYDCQAHSGLSGGPVLEKEKNRVIGIHINSSINKDESRGDRHGIRFTSEIIKFIENALRNWRIEQKLTIEREEVSQVPIVITDQKIGTVGEHPITTEPFKEPPPPAKKEKAKCDCCAVM